MGSEPGVSHQKRATGKNIISKGRPLTHVLSAYVFTKEFHSD